MRFHDGMDDRMVASLSPTSLPKKLSCLKPITVLLSSGISIFIFVISMLIESYGDRYSTDILSHFKENSTICDRGIGTAAFSLAFAQTITPTTHITGVDLSSEMLNKAHQQLSQATVFIIKSVI